jgi:hypothetical protein
VRVRWGIDHWERWCWEAVNRCWEFGVAVREVRGCVWIFLKSFRREGGRRE